MKQQKIYPTLTGDTCLSHYNLSAEALDDCRLPPSVSIKDQTLREGEQAAMSGFSLEKKIEIARLLDETGVHYLQVGYPGLSDSENKMIRKIADLGLKAKVGGIALVYLPEWQEQIDRAIDSGVSWISVAYGLSPVRLAGMMKVPVETAVKRLLRATEYAAGKGLVVQVNATDTTRTPLETLLDLFRSAERAGASMVGVSDTAGAITPPGMRYLVRRIVKAIDIPVGVHCHNDLGLAMANCLAGLEAGASLVDVTVNGMGERAGNVSLAEIATVLTHAYGYNLGLHLEEMTLLAHRVAELSRLSVPKSKPLVGEYAFTHTLGAHQWGVRQAWYTYESVRAEAVGNTRYLPLGRLTHYLLVREKLRENGFIDLDDKTIKATTEEIRKIAESESRFVEDGELTHIVQAQIHNQ